MLPSFCRTCKHVPQARMMPLFFTNLLIEPSRRGNLSSFTFSTSTPLPSKNIFTAWLFLSASLQNLKQFQQVSASFVFKITPIFILYLALSTISIISLSTSSASLLLTSGKNCDIIVGFIPIIFTFPFSSITLILQGIQREINLFLFRN